MIVERRLGTGWQTVLTDLSLILFMVTASALTDPAPAQPRPAPARPTPPAERSEPVAVWRPGIGTPTLARWLAAADHRARATLRVVYRPGEEAAALATAQALAAEAGPGHAPLRVLVEPGATPATEVTLAYDARAAEPANGTRLAAHGP